MTAPTPVSFAFDITTTDIDIADAVMRLIETSFPGTQAQFDIRGGDEPTVRVTVTPPPQQRLFVGARGETIDFVEFDGTVLLDDRDQAEPAATVRTCRKCGCTDAAACPGGCSWIDDDLCSACDEQVMVGFDGASSPATAEFANVVALVAADGTVSLRSRSVEAFDAAARRAAETVAMTEEDAVELGRQATEGWAVAPMTESIFPNGDFDPSGWTPVGTTDEEGTYVAGPDWLLSCLVGALRMDGLFPAPREIEPRPVYGEAWSNALDEFEGMSTRRIIIAALDALDLSCRADPRDLICSGDRWGPLDVAGPLIDEWVPLFERAIALEASAAERFRRGLADVYGAPPAGSGAYRRDVGRAEPEPSPEIAGEAADREAAGIAAGSPGDSGSSPAPDHDGHTITLGPLTSVDGQPVDPPADMPAENAGGSGDAGVREDPEGPDGPLATPPEPPASFTATPGPLTDQVVELLNAYPDVIFRPGHVDDALAIGDPVLAAGKLRKMAKAGRIAKIARGQYQALRSNGTSTELRERITEWFEEHDTGSAETIAGALTADVEVVKAELRRMGDADLIRPGGRGWRARDTSDTAALHKARRLAATEAM